MSRVQRFRVIWWSLLLVVCLVGAFALMAAVPVARADCELGPSYGECILATAYANLTLTPSATPPPAPITISVPIWSSPLTPVILALTAVIAVYRAIRKFIA